MAQWNQRADLQRLTTPIDGVVQQMAVHTVGGVATGLDMARLEAQLAVEWQRGSSARYDLEHAKLGLINLLALPRESRLVLADEWPTDMQDIPSPQHAVEDALASLAAAKEQVGIAQTGLQIATKELDLARVRYTVITAASHFELTNGLSAAARTRENLVTALFQLNAARVNVARSTGNLTALN